MPTFTVDPQRDWDKEWEQLNLTVDDDVWLLTERIKLRYLLPRLRPGMRALEVGCGSAKLSALLAREGLEVYGVDQSANGLRVAKRNFAYWGTTGHVARADAFALPFADGQFDLAFSTGLLEHFSDPMRLMRSMLRTLRPGGLFFSDVVPLKFSLIRSAWYLKGLHKTVDDEHPYRRPDVERWMRGCGLESIEVFSSCVVPPLGLFARLPQGRRLSRSGEWLWTSLDGTWLADALGFFYLAFGRKPIAVEPSP